MGELNLPIGSSVYIDTPILIYTLENHPDFYPLLKPLWAKFGNSEISIFTSELIITEGTLFYTRSQCFEQLAHKEEATRAEIVASDVVHFADEIALRSPSSDTSRFACLQRAFHQADETGLQSPIPQPE
jgi:predicted nucleic acid-binding protein